MRPLQTPDEDFHHAITGFLSEWGSRHGTGFEAVWVWPWQLTPLLAQATGAWLISLGVTAGQALLERDARRLRPAMLGYVLLAVLQAIAVARYPEQFGWDSAAGVIYLIFLATILLTGLGALATKPRRQGAPYGAELGRPTTGLGDRRLGQ